MGCVRAACGSIKCNVVVFYDKFLGMHWNLLPANRHGIRPFIYYYYYYCATWRINLLTINFMPKWPPSRPNGMWKQQIMISLEFVSCWTRMAAGQRRVVHFVFVRMLTWFWLCLVWSFMCVCVCVVPNNLCDEKNTRTNKQQRFYGNNDVSIWYARCQTFL